MSRRDALTVVALGPGRKRLGYLHLSLYGFAKNEKDNLSLLELQDYQKAAQAYHRLNEADIGNVSGMRGGTSGSP